MNIYFLGDVHASWKNTRKILAETPGPVLQVGDFGYGFNEDEFRKHFGDWPVNLWAMRGNHDDPARWAQCNSPDGNSVKNFGQINGFHESVFVLCGGYSIDRKDRIVGVDYWPDEEISWEDANRAHKAWKASSATVLVSHEPASSYLERYTTFKQPSRTSVVIQGLINARKPRVHIYGHMHESQRFIQEGVFCVGLDIDEVTYLDTNDL